jgi:hypothetical protein
MEETMSYPLGTRTIRTKKSKIILTQWEMAQCETALRERVEVLREMQAEPDVIAQTTSLQRYFAGAQSVKIELPS